jgi:serine/threonine protein kinase
MPRLICPNGHQWDSPSGADTPAPGKNTVCPVCGAPTETFPAPGVRTPLADARTATPCAAPARSAVAEPLQRTAIHSPEPLAPSAGPAPDLVPGYEVLEELGRGGMGIVYRGRRLADDGIVALKVIRKDRLIHPEAVRRFRREAHAAARLSHPNIVRVYDADQAGDTHFLAMEYVEGVTLQRLVEMYGCLPVAQACDYLRQIALGLQHAHEQALVHRDVKPANLMVTTPPLGSAGASPSQPGSPAPMGHARYRGAVVKLLDMGVARLYQLSDNPEDLLTTLTQDGAMLGTPDYIAPEQLEDAHHADIRADLYSLGCTFHFLLTGSVPFPGGTLIQKLDRHRWEMPPAVEQVRPEVPAAVGALVRKLMAKRPQDRYQTPGELAAALEHLARTGHVPAEPRPPAVLPAMCFTGHADAVWGVAVAPDGSQAVSGGRDRTIRLWKLDRAAPDDRRPADPACRPSVLDAAAAAGAVLPEQGQQVRAVAWSGDGRHLLSASGATLRLWQVPGNVELARLGGHSDTINAVAFSPDGRRALSGGDDKALRLWDVVARRELRRLPGHARAVSSLAFSPDGLRAVSGGRDQTLRLWDLAAGRELRCLTAQQGLILDVAFSPDGRLALAGNFDTTVRLWDLGAGKEVRRFQGHRQMVSAVVFTPDGRRVLSGGHDQTVRLWDVDSARELHCLEGPAGAVTCLAVTPDGRHVLAACADRSLYLWQIPVT